MEQWVTVAEVVAALDRFEAAAPDYRRPAAHGLVVDGEIAVWNVGAHPLPAAVLATVLGHDGSTAAIPVSQEDLDRAIDLLAPAEACVEFDHPNLQAWRKSKSRNLVAVFIA